MKLSILIFVLTTITYGCQCAPIPNWVEDLQRDMQKMTQEIHENQKQMDKTFKNLGQQFQKSQKHFEEQMKNINQLPDQGINEVQDLNDMNVSSHSMITTSHIVNGNRVDKIIVEKVIDNVKYRTETNYTSATGKTEIKKYECNLPPNSQCVLKSTEVKDGPPENFNEYL